MTEALAVINERVDDLPLLLAQLGRLGVQPLLDAHFPNRDWRPGHRVRDYGGRPARVRRERAVSITVAIDEVAMAAAVRQLGWRVYATNLAPDQLAAFREITLTIWQEPQQTRRHVTPLSPLQQHILGLLDFSPAIYTRLCTDGAKPP